MSSLLDSCAVEDLSSSVPVDVESSSDGEGEGNLLGGETLHRSYGFGIIGEDSEEEQETTSEVSSEGVEEGFSALVEDGMEEFTEFMSSSYQAAAVISSSATHRHEEKKEAEGEETTSDQQPVRSIPPLSTQSVELIRTCMSKLKMKSPSAALEAHAAAITKARLRLGDELIK